MLHGLGRLLAVVLAAGSCATTPDSPATVVESRRGLPPERTSTLGTRLVLVPAGEFTMGSDSGPIDERPAHRVRISRPFYLAMHEVTQAEFERFVEATGHVTTAEREGGTKVWAEGQWEVDPNATWRTIFPGPRRPVVAVTWNDALAFCEWLTQQERDAGVLAPGEAYRLPTEAQWEWAARAGTSHSYSGTADRADVCQYGNVPDRAADDAGLGRSFVPCNDGVGIGTANVGAFAPNAWGLHDMTGNVQELVRDGYAPYRSDPALDPLGPGDAELRVVRGGSWSGKLSGLRVTHREGYGAELRGGSVGFRVALETGP